VQGVSWWRIIPHRFSETDGLESKDLRKAGLKVTGPRLKILEILEGSPTRHMSAEGIYKRLIESNEDIGLATVYRVLTQFQAAGLVSRHHFEDGMAVFELNQGTHHDHIVCLDCGRVEEFIDESIEERQEEIATRLGYELRDHAMTLYGHCRKPGCPSAKGAQKLKHS
jgi:Fur family ferric uptake transcriptional regulator